MFDMQRPKIKVSRDTTDKVIETLTVLSLVFSFGFIGFHYSELPDLVPAHFGLDGKVNRYDEKSMIWFLPLLLSVICFGIYILNKQPYLYNYAIKITSENAEKQYRSSTKMMRYINLSLALICAVITYEMVTIALSNSTNFSPFSNYFLILILAFLTITPIVLVIKNLFQQQ
ncbi:DUF1648 domain-containing protein [Bizionia paragorgiae]|mgnify:CR=1 FL=1|uniref:DUF1648 domain-containing protein n=1 Tax=Bizionia paragorgiae TaxID=283786 RepID=A0A1H3YE21_BIZPA|nr:DUF1648 domain-containing protein [Bizionia paragorgiae]MDX1271164.1 DUF1648 domain-containing protein [Bizionia paragorgiae]SEA09880.1 Protein of unknown function [Bizionia paragorgiae]